MFDTDAEQLAQALAALEVKPPEVMASFGHRAFLSHFETLSDELRGILLGDERVRYSVEVGLLMNKALELLNAGDLESHETLCRTVDETMARWGFFVEQRDDPEVSGTYFALVVQNQIELLRSAPAEFARRWGYKSVKDGAYDYHPWVIEALINHQSLGPLIQAAKASTLLPQVAGGPDPSADAVQLAKAAFEECGQDPYRLWQWARGNLDADRLEQLQRHPDLWVDLRDGEHFEYALNFLYRASYGEFSRYCAQNLSELGYARVQKHHSALFRIGEEGEALQKAVKNHTFEQYFAARKDEYARQDMLSHLAAIPEVAAALGYEGVPASPEPEAEPATPSTMVVERTRAAYEKDGKDLWRLHSWANQNLSGTERDYVKNSSQDPALAQALRDADNFVAADQRTGAHDYAGFVSACLTTLSDAGLAWARTINAWEFRAGEAVLEVLEAIASRRLEAHWAEHKQRYQKEGTLRFLHENSTIAAALKKQLEASPEIAADQETVAREDRDSLVEALSDLDTLSPLDFYRKYHTRFSADKPLRKKLLAEAEIGRTYSIGRFVSETRKAVRGKERSAAFALVLRSYEGAEPAEAKALEADVQLGPLLADAREHRSQVEQARDAARAMTAIEFYRHYSKAFQKNRELRKSLLAVAELAEKYKTGRAHADLVRACGTDGAALGRLLDEGVTGLEPELRKALLDDEFVQRSLNKYASGWALLEKQQYFEFFHFCRLQEEIAPTVVNQLLSTEKGQTAHLYGQAIDAARNALPSSDSTRKTFIAWWKGHRPEDKALRHAMKSDPVLGPVIARAESKIGLRDKPGYKRI